MSGLGRVRNIRPRPINYEERIPVVWLDKKQQKAAGGYEVDGALEQFLRSFEAEQAQLQAAGAKSVKLSGCSRRASAPKPCNGSVAGPPRHEADAKIAVPQIRDVEDYDQNEAAMQEHADAAAACPSRTFAPTSSVSGLGISGLSVDVSGDHHAGAYIIYQDVLRERRGDAGFASLYDMDVEDESVLAAINDAQRRQRASEAGPSNRMPMTEDAFEGLMQALELAHFAVLQQRKDLWQSDVKAGKVPRLPSDGELLPWNAAKAAVQQQPTLPALPRPLYNHWIKQRRKARGPLLQHLWYEQPWKAICFASTEPGCEGEIGDMPFMASETKNSRGGWQRLRIDAEEAHDLLAGVRGEMELLRTLADQVRKRERLKKQLAKLYRLEKAQELGLPMPKHHHIPVLGAPAAAGHHGHVHHHSLGEGHAHGKRHSEPRHGRKPSSAVPLSQGNAPAVTAVAKPQKGRQRAQTGRRPRGARELEALLGKPKADVHVVSGCDSDKQANRTSDSQEQSTSSGQERLSSSEEEEEERPAKRRRECARAAPQRAAQSTAVKRAAPGAGRGRRKEVLRDSSGSDEDSGHVSVTSGDNDSTVLLSQTPSSSNEELPSSSQSISSGSGEDEVSYGSTSSSGAEAEASDGDSADGSSQDLDKGYEAGNSGQLSDDATSGGNVGSAKSRRYGRNMRVAAAPRQRQRAQQLRLAKPRKPQPRNGLRAHAAVQAQQHRKQRLAAGTPVSRKRLALQVAREVASAPKRARNTGTPAPSKKAAAAVTGVARPVLAGHDIGIASKHRAPLRERKPLQAAGLAGSRGRVAAKAQVKRQAAGRGRSVATQRAAQVALLAARRRARSRNGAGGSVDRESTQAAKAPSHVEEGSGMRMATRAGGSKPAAWSVAAKGSARRSKALGLGGGVAKGPTRGMDVPDCITGALMAAATRQQRGKMATSPKVKPRIAKQRAQARMSRVLR